MLKTIIVTLAFLSVAGLVLAEEPYKSREVDYSLHEGWTATSDFFCWSGTMPIHDISELVAIPKDDYSVLVEFYGDTEILNCIQDVILPGGEKVVVHRINVLY